jgi:hypothetical protein
MGDNRDDDFKEERKNPEMSFEVTFEVFKERFLCKWHTMMGAKMRKKLSEAFLWTEMMSVIKGSERSAQYAEGFLPQDEYINIGTAQNNTYSKEVGLS